MANDNQVIEVKPEEVQLTAEERLAYNEFVRDKSYGYDPKNEEHRKILKFGLSRLPRPWIFRSFSPGAFSIDPFSYAWCNVCEKHMRWPVSSCPDCAEVAAQQNKACADVVDMLARPSGVRRG